MKKFAVLAGALALAASAAQAAVYDAFDSFDGTQGAGGFAYLKLPGGPGAATLLTSPPSCVVTSDFCLQDGSGLPGVYKSLTELSEVTYTVPDDRLLVHPGPSNPIGIFFNAPEAGDYDYVLSLNILDISPSGVGIAGVTNATGTVVAAPLTFLSAGNPTFTKTGTITLAKGQFFGVIVNNGGNYSNDSTGVDFTLTTGTAVPEPASWALMIAGFGLVGGLARRRGVLTA